MSGRAGGKLKPLKVLSRRNIFSESQLITYIFGLQAPKKEKKEETEDEIAFKEKKKAEQAALKEAREKGTFFCPLHLHSYLNGPLATQHRRVGLFFSKHFVLDLYHLLIGGPPGGGIKKYVLLLIPSVLHPF